MTSFITSIVDYYNSILAKGDPRVENWTLMANPWPLLGILSVYYYFIKYAGPKLMENRKPYDLKTTMVCYNVGQVLINVWAVFQAYKIIVHPEHSLVCTPLVRSTSKFHMKVTSVSYIYLLLKIADLMDTIFMVLRKNYRQITFLHVYHHMGMAAGSWVVVKYISGAHLTMVGLINCFVHSVMYFYYLLTAYDSDIKKSIWWKKHITELQMVQFTLILLHHTFTLLNPNCSYPKVALFIFITQNLLIVYLFSKFYYETYIKPAKKDK